MTNSMISEMKASVKVLGNVEATKIGPSNISFCFQFLSIPRDFFFRVFNPKPPRKESQISFLVEILTDHRDDKTSCFLFFFSLSPFHRLHSLGSPGSDPLPEFISMCSSTQSSSRHSPGRSRASSFSKRLFKPRRSWQQMPGAEESIFPPA